MNLPKWVKDDYVYWLVGSGLTSIYAIGYIILTGHYFDEGWLHPLLILGIISGFFSFGLALRKEWSRWLGICLLSLIVVFFTWKLLYIRFSMVSVLGLVCTLLSIGYLWFLPITRVQAMLSDPEVMAKLMSAKDHALEEFASYKHWKIVVFFRSTPAIDINSFAKTVEKIFKVQFVTKSGTLDPVDASFLPGTHPSPFVAGEPPILLCFNPPVYFGFYEYPEKFPMKSLDVVKPLSNSFQQLLSNHTAWIEIEILPYFGNSISVDNGYAFTGKIAAELLNENAIAVLLPDHNQFYPSSVELKELLASADPATALDSIYCNTNN
jgi:hypothetical protein